MHRPLATVVALMTVLLAACSLPGQATQSSPPDVSANAKACTVTSATPGSGPATQVEPAVAEQVVRQYWDAADRANQQTGKLDCAATAQTDEGPSFAASVTAAQIYQQLGTHAQNKPNPIQSLNVYVPRLATYPLWIAAIVKKFDVDQNTGKVQSTTSYHLMVLTKMSAQARWKGYLGMDVPGGSPKVAKDAEGYAKLPAGGKPVVDPAALPQTYVDYLASRGAQHATLFAPGDATDGTLQSTEAKNGLTWEFGRYDNLVFALAMQDGSVMTIFDDVNKAHATTSGTACYAQDDKRTKLPIYYPPGRWHDVYIDSIMIRVGFVPNRTGQVMMAGDNSLILSKGSNPC